MEKEAQGDYRQQANESKNLPPLETVSDEPKNEGLMNAIQGALELREVGFVRPLTINFTERGGRYPVIRHARERAKS